MRTRGRRGLGWLIVFNLVGFPAHYFIVFYSIGTISIYHPKISAVSPAVMALDRCPICWGAAAYPLVALYHPASALCRGDWLGLAPELARAPAHLLEF